ncbi:MAG: hypothetical protein NT098_00730 [Candidatus Parcubacteria bacterium]|nr:hypothetical protein [Candidatus Parcubacteria bacterium]
MLGWIGVAMLTLAYCFFAFKKTNGLFAPVNMVASAILTLHAWNIHDMPFVLVNGFIALVLCKKLFEK